MLFSTLFGGLFNGRYYYFVISTAGSAGAVITAFIRARFSTVHS